MEGEEPRSVVFGLPATAGLVGERASQAPPGIIGSVRKEARPRSTKIWVVALRGRPLEPSGSPEFGFTSKCGKLLPAISSRRRCPRRNRLAVGNIAIATAYTSPGRIGKGFSQESR